MTGKRASSARGFTLVELLVVVGIIALLVTILMPSLGRALELARRARCAANLHTLGRAWILYWRDNNEAIPGLTRSNTVSQSGIYVYHNNSIVNTGWLWANKLLPSEDVFICPTTDRNTADEWFDDWHGAYPPWRSPNPWPPGKRRPDGSTYHHARMTYQTRRMEYYTQEQVNASGETPFMLRTLKLGGVKLTTDFSFMSDNLNNARLTKMSHYPGVNVLDIRGSVHYFIDETAPSEVSTPGGKILYDDNGMDPSVHDSSNNWPQDRVWMYIDGTMTPEGG
ncbi:hypothetical protein LCGC14_1600650 [marine sediment metagenome]|uniref:Type II secretion system protein GspG C-terminal domain-containing protein n=1 Tax=marine sediment metagenome TaxID=412755 RepID=A0A0F9KRX0_9ZZZZ